MNHQPQDNRRRAEHTFANALDELETVLKSESSDSPQPPPGPRPSARRRPPHPPRRVKGMDEAGDFGALLEDAVQDIEQFMASEQSPQEDP